MITENLISAAIHEMAAVAPEVRYRFPDHAAFLLEVARLLEEDPYKNDETAKQAKMMRRLAPQITSRAVGSPQ